MIATRLFRLLGLGPVLGIAVFGLPALPAHSEPLGDRVPAGYQSLQESKALAVVPGGTDVQGLIHDQPNDLLAAMTALQICDSQRQPEQPHCELVRLNGEPITTGAEIRESIPAAVHPLYLWRAESASATVYLAGSIHILKASLYPLPDPYEVAFLTADQLVVEVDVSARSEQEIRQKTMAHATLPDGSRLQEVVSDELLTRLTEVVERFGLPLGQLDSIKPAMIMNQLVILRLMSLGYDPRWGIDHHYLDRRGEREVLELESIDDQLSLLFDQPMELQIQLLQDTLEQDAELESLLASMVTAWFTGDDEGFMEMFAAQSGDSDLARRFTEQLLTERNLRMADRISDLLDNRGTYFVLVGAAHLIGDDGIPALLEQSGRKPQRIFSDGSVQGTDQRNHNSI
jgi:uncharacterized protein YbaP (TraB family)